MRLYRPRYRVLPLWLNEVDALFELYRRVGADQGKPEGVSVAEIQAWLEGGFELYQVQHQGRLVGAMRLTFPVGVCWLDHLAVDPDHRRRGYGRSLVDHGLHRARRLGSSRIWVGIRAETGAGELAFYERLGFIQSGYHRLPTESESLLLLEASL
ncbi:MAG: GNAT family N-acetyltransferase [Candidatus Dormibacteraceae bacterium]